METFREILARELVKRMKVAGLSSTAYITGTIIAEVFGPDGKLKQRSVSHNIVVDQGDASVADLLANTPLQTKFDGTNGFIEVGTGWTGVSPKTNTKVNTQATAGGGGNAPPLVMDGTYPKLKAAWAAIPSADSKTIVYKVTFTAGLLNATGINEAAIVNSVTHAAGHCMAYGQITPSVNVGILDTLAVTWEIKYLGA